MTNLNITHSNVNQSNGLVAMFGNQRYGEIPNPNQSIKLFWLKQIKRSQTMSGDVTLFNNGVAIRTVRNANERLLDKQVKYPCTYIKH